MIIKKIELTSIQAEDGYILTDGETYSQLVYLGTADSIDNWKEIPIEEYEAMEGEDESIIS